MHGADDKQEGISADSLRLTSAMLAKQDVSHATQEFMVEDNKMVKLAMQGSASAFEYLVKRHQVRIFALLSRFTTEPAEVEDLAQDVFLKTFKALPKFRFGSAFYTWLYRIALNTATDFVNNKKRSPVRHVEDVQNLEQGCANSPSTPHQLLSTAETAQITRHVLQEMPGKYRQILILREFEGLAYEEIAAILGCAMGTVESRLFRARAKFREFLLRMYPEYASSPKE